MKIKLDVEVREVWLSLHVPCLTVQWLLHTQIDLKILKEGSSGSNFQRLRLKLLRYFSISFESFILLASSDNDEHMSVR